MVELDIEKKDLRTLATALVRAETEMRFTTFPSARSRANADEYARLRQIINARAAQGPEERNHD